MDDRRRRMAKNEALFRAVNREIERASVAVGDQELEVLCECGREGCEAVLTIIAAEYERVHAQDDRFILQPGHETPELERIVERTERYVIVDKFGEAEELAEEQ